MYFLEQNPWRNKKEGVQSVTRGDEERKTHWAKRKALWNMVRGSLRCPEAPYPFVSQTFAEHPLSAWLWEAAR